LRNLERSWQGSAQTTNRKRLLELSRSNSEEKEEGIRVRHQRKPKRKLAKVSIEEKIPMNLLKDVISSKPKNKKPKVH